MKFSKLSIVFVFVLFSLNTLSAQMSVFKGRTLFKDTDAATFFFFTLEDSKSLKKDLEKYLDAFGKLSTIKKNQYKLERIKGNKWSDDLNSIDVVIDDTKKMQKVNFYFLDKAEVALRSNQMKDLDAMQFVEDFQNITLKSVELEMAEINLKYANDDLSDANKDLNKIQKQLENNLKDQEKLGKKLDQNPELMSKAISEKVDIVNKMNTDSLNVAAADLSKASTKKEKEIIKIKKDAEKAQSKLEKKEADFDALKNELFKTKSKLKSLELVQKDAEEILKRLEKLRE